jgi:hypothetical protein
MRYARAVTLILLAALSGCGSDETVPITEPPDPSPPVLLKDVVASSLPSPFYHFEYDTRGRVTSASFASGLRMYDVAYSDDRISEVTNNVIVNHDRLQYTYDDAGRVSAVKYVNSSGVFTVVFFSYDGSRLAGLERDRRVDAGFIIDKTMTLSYYADGNLRELVEHRPAIDGQQDETTTIDRFENYDAGINVDAFTLIHDEFFDHLILLPGVQLQKGNPGRVTHTGDGLNFVVDFTYNYDAMNRPLVKNGSVTILNGSDAGRRTSISTLFSYY